VYVPVVGSQSTATMWADPRRLVVGGKPWLTTRARPMAADVVARELPSGRAGAAAEWGGDWGGLYAPLAARFDECFLLPGGTDSRRVLATGPPTGTASTRSSPSTSTTCPTSA
jgi:hypothetical protein